MYRYAFATVMPLFCLLFLPSNGQICTRTEIQFQWVTVTNTFTYRETYHNWYLTTKTRLATMIKYERVRKTFTTTRQICCEGYTDVNGSYNCQPICIPQCKNGYCLRPNKCVCNNGYVSDPAENHNCKPICKEDCKNGFCISPENCECFSGYWLTENNTCEPYCFSGCPNGYCVSPNRCRCNDGWVINQENNTCLPYCVNPCGNGTCVSPYNCECSKGYEIDLNYDEKSNATVCVPSCDNCINGSCIAPNVCVCEPPFLSITTSNCNASVTCRLTTCVMEESTTTDDYTSDLSTISPQPYDQSQLYEFSNESFSKGDYFSDTASTSSFSEQTTYSTERSYVTAIEPVKNTNNLNMKDRREVKTTIWVYATASSIALVAILLIIVVARRNSIASWMKGGSYVVQ